MRFTNNFNEPVIVFLYNHTDLVWPVVVGSAGQLSNLPAAVEQTVAAGQTTTTLSHPDGLCYIGVKRAIPPVVSRLGPFLAAPTLDIYDDTAVFELTLMAELVWVNRPVVPDPTPRLPTQDLLKPLPAAPGYVVGVGKAEVTDPAANDPLSELPMQGWASPSQKSTGIESPLFARAFIIADPKTRQRVVMVIVDIWSCSIALKEAVVARLQNGNSEVPYRTDNIFIAGTHTHSAHAGFLHHLLYNAAAFGFDPHVFECMVRGIVRAIELAHSDMAPGAVYLEESDITGLTRNRSMPAFARNPASDRAVFPRGVDERMTLLKFVHAGKKPALPETAIGVLNWFAIHPTNRGANNLLITGDNKGWAEMRFEQEAPKLPNTRKNFVAAFANSACGDVSGNFKPRSRPNQFDPPISDDPVLVSGYIKRMQSVGETQFAEALALFNRAQTKLTGPIGMRHQRLDLPRRSGTQGSLGLSMPAGSSEDGGKGVIPEGLCLVDPRNPLMTTGGPISALAMPITFALGGLLNAINALANPTSIPAQLQAILASTPLGQGAAAALLVTQFPKPILMVPGELVPVPLTPNIMPIQILRIGSLAVLGVPAEITTVAGLRLRRAAASELSKLEVTRLVVGAYANGYASYITTPEEYESQEYEGASTLFGPMMCSVFEQAFRSLAATLVVNSTAADDAPQPNLSNAVLTKRRMTFRNLSSSQERIRLYLVGDVDYTFVTWGGADFTLDPGAERAVIVPITFSWFLQNLQVVVGSAPLSKTQPPTRRVFARTSDLIVIGQNGMPVASPYMPTAR